VKRSEIEGRAERLIEECRELDIEPTPQTVAEIMIDQDEPTDGEGSSREAARTYVEYKKAAASALISEEGETPS
jgi:hypothetical protein